MTIDEYIKKRKTEDRLNEFDREKQADNLRIVVNYVFEYFNNYLDTIPEQEQEMLEDKRLIRYRKRVSGYSSEIQNWLIDLYVKSNHYVDRVITNILRVEPFFLIFDSDAEFRALSYELFAEIKKQLKDISIDSEMLFQFMKEYHKKASVFNPRNDFCLLPEDIIKWVTDAYDNYSVNLYQYCWNRLDLWFNNPNQWPKGHRVKSNDYDKYKGSDMARKYPEMLWEYNYKASTNLFGLDDLYHKMPKKKFISHHKKHMEILSMFIWLHEMSGNTEYWDEYLSEHT